MPQINSQFTPEQIRAFEDKYNLGVNNREAMVELFMRQEQDLNIAHMRIDEMQECQKNIVERYNKQQEQIDKHHAILGPDAK